MDKKQAYFQITGGSIPEYAFFGENYDAADPQFHLNSTLSFKFTPDTRVLTSLCGITVNQKGVPVMKCSLTFDYTIAEETISDFTKNKRIVIPKDILRYFASNSLGALRGAIMAKLETTPFKFILPPVNVADIIEEPLAISLQPQ